MDLFQSCDHCWVFQICWHIECSTFTASSFRIWNSSTGFSSPPLALFVVMLSKAHLTSHSRMSGSRWVITPLWLSGSWRSFLYHSSVYSCYLLISSASVRSIPFLFFIESNFAWNVPLEICSLPHSVIFLYFFALIADEGFLISLLVFGTLHSNGSIFPFLLCFSLLFFSRLFLRPPQTTILLFWISFFLGMVLISASGTMSWISVHSSWGTLWGLICWIYLWHLLCNHKGFDLSHTWMV